MKKLLILFSILFIFSNIFAQFDPPSSYTKWQRLRLWAQKARPSADSLNKNWTDLDSLLNALIVLTDTTQLEIVNGVLIFSQYSSGHNSFTTTAQTDTVSILGLDSGDVFIVNVRETVPGANDLLSVKLINNKAIIQRPASGTSGLKYNWIWRRKY